MRDMRFIQSLESDIRVATLPKCNLFSFLQYKFEKLLDEDKIRLKVYSLLFLFIPHILVTFQTS